VGVLVNYMASYETHKWRISEVEIRHLYVD